MDDFKKYLLSKQIVSRKTRYYLNWVLQLRVFCKKDPGTQVSSNEISRYLSQLSKRQEEGQVQQAREAISLYTYSALFISVANTICGGDALEG